jgi:hypothetical protein
MCRSDVSDALRRDFWLIAHARAQERSYGTRVARVADVSGNLEAFPGGSNRKATRPERLGVLITWLTGSAEIDGRQDMRVFRG